MSPCFNCNWVYFEHVILHIFVQKLTQRQLKLNFVVQVCLYIQHFGGHIFKMLGQFYIGPHREHWSTHMHTGMFRHTPIVWSQWYLCQLKTIWIICFGDLYHMTASPQVCKMISTSELQLCACLIWLLSPSLWIHHLCFNNRVLSQGVKGELAKHGGGKT